MAILRIRDANGKVQEIPVIKVDGGNGTLTGSILLYSEQTLTNEQKAQARENIGATTQENANAYTDTMTAIVAVNARDYTNETVAAHNNATDVHTDMRTEITQLANCKAAVTYVDEKVALAIAGKTHLEANFAQNIEGCTDTSKVYMLPDGYIYAYIYAMGVRPEITVDGATGGYYESGPKWVSGEGFCAKWTNILPVTPGDQFSYTGYAKYGAISVVWYDADKVQISTEQFNDGWTASTFTVTVPENAVYAQFFSYKDTTAVENVVLEVSWISCQATDTIRYRWVNTGHAFVPADYEDRIIALEKNAVSKGSGVLGGKKYVACGDSFTAGPFAEKTEETWSEEYGVYKTYPYWIASRNNMTLVNEAVSGTDFTNRSGANTPFSVSRYKAIPADADYITLMFGLNETDIGNDSAAIGTKDDTTNTTLWGAYNTVFEYLLTNLPYAKIGVILADAWMTESYANAVKEICKYWGVPCLDLKGEDVPMGISGRYTETSAKAKALRNAAFQVSDTDSHPNVKAHQYRSTVIENFLRSL